MRPDEIMVGRSYYKDRPDFGPKYSCHVLDIYKDGDTTMVRSSDFMPNGKRQEDVATLEQFSEWVDKELL